MEKGNYISTSGIQVVICKVLMADLRQHNSLSNLAEKIKPLQVFTKPNTLLRGLLRIQLWEAMSDEPIMKASQLSA